jgi:mono/diheme cytochrome c family protein
MPSLHHHAAVLLTFGLLAGCGGDHARTRTGTDTSGAATVTPDSAAMPMKDTAGPAASASDTASSRTPADTARRPSAVAPTPKPAPTKTAAASDTSAKRSPAPKTKQMAAAGARTAHDTGSAPSGQAARDTGRVQAAESTKSAAAPTPQQQTPAPTTPAAPQQDTTQQQAPLRDAYHPAPRDTVDQATYDGWKQFNLNCARCHGEDALGTTIAPHLIMSLKPDGPINTKELFVQTVCAGRPAKGMPSWCALGLDMQKINDIYLYVKGRSDAKLAPGRPAVKAGG